MVSRTLKRYSNITPYVLAIPFWGPIVPQNTGSLCGLLQLVQNIMDFLTTLAVPLAVVFVIYAGFRLLAAAGSETSIKAGKDAIKAVVIGLVIVFGSWLLVNTVMQLFGVGGGWGNIQC